VFVLTARIRECSHMNWAFCIVLLFILLDCVTNVKSLTFEWCHIPLTAFYRPVKAVLAHFPSGFSELECLFLLHFQCYKQLCWHMQMIEWSTCFLRNRRSCQSCFTVVQSSKESVSRARLFFSFSSVHFLELQVYIETRMCGAFLLSWMMITGINWP